MEIGHIVNIDGVDYCISDIKMYGNHKFALTVYGQGTEDSCNAFFELIDDEEGGTLMREVVDDVVLNELLKLFLYSED